MKGLGCHVAGVWVGAAGYADDLVLLAPSRETMSKMLKVCADYAEIHNLVFSTDVNPLKSKTKCIFMNGKKGNELPNGVPKPLELYGKNLPWVPYATHLGHELHQSCTMEFDCRIKRAKFIDSSLEIRDTFSFAHPNQILTAVQMYSLHCYGSMLWDFGDESTGKFCRSWNTCVKLCNRVPRSTHTYFVENLLATDFIPVRNQLFSRYVNFAKHLLTSASYEVRFLYGIVHKSNTSITGKNLKRIQMEVGLNPWSMSPAFIKEEQKVPEVPMNEQWRLPLLETYLKRRKELELSFENTETIQHLIDTLCNS